MICAIILTSFPPSKDELIDIGQGKGSFDPSLAFECSSIPTKETEILLAQETVDGSSDRFFKIHHCLLLSKTQEEAICLLFCDDITESNYSYLYKENSNVLEYEK